MGLDMYLFKAKKLDGYTYEQLSEMKEEINFVESYADALELSKDFDNKYDERHYWNRLGETPEEKKKRIHESLMQFINEAGPRYLELKDKYDDQFKERMKDFTHEEVGYWRKVNQIHAWFVDNVQNGTDDCGYYPVTKDQLLKLRRSCELASNNIEHAETLLPTRSGFFFGSTDYDDWYKQDLEETKQIIDKVLNETDFDNEVIVYSSSW